MFRQEDRMRETYWIAIIALLGETEVKKRGLRYNFYPKIRMVLQDGVRKYERQMAFIVDNVMRYSPRKQVERGHVQGKLPWVNLVIQWV
ncbi:hypothetical protein BWQ96_06502 [Gracilariopsis chorda]|uniref:Uncharacterized protein n=1 Tax=Gracilariopsis chorda TaxID=448386 RepID=A0A2V3IRJ0_9FLOR|nr:hypothetical protein BWQ96_06502 [Gracilariopsis chorda]|eukprot:PXF43770.1 hypothetical protein BWQ96_06502 [Gracilariopsis chorda]